MSPRKRSPLTIELTLLGLLQKGPKHGYELHKEITNSPCLSMIWNVKISKLYSLLERLEKDDLLTSTYISDEKSPGRKEYKILNKGQQVFQDWIQSPVKNGRDMRLIFHARLYFALDQGKNAAFELIDEQQHECQQWIERMQIQAEKFMDIDFIAKQIYLYRLGQVKAMISWLENCKSNILAQ